MPKVIDGLDPITERDLRPITAKPAWGRHREMWRENTPRAGAAARPR